MSQVRAVWARPRTGAAAAIVVMALLGCGGDDDPQAPSVGDIDVITATTGEDLDADGYTITVDDAGARTVAANATTRITGLAVGNHTVAIDGLAANCTVGGDNPRTVAVTGDEVATVTFAVTCTAVNPGPQLGSVRVTVVTSGTPADADGYAVSVDGGTAQPLTDAAAVTFADLSVGAHTVQISGVAGNCSVTGGASRQADVTAGGTAEVAFEVTCSSQARILFISMRDEPNGEVYSANPDGTDIVRLTNNTVYEGDAAWSPDYSKIVFSSRRDGNTEVYTMNADGSGVQRLTQDDGPDGIATWSPDGSKIAFTSDRNETSTDVYVMNPDGTGIVNVSQAAGVDQAPVWSPDGTRIAFFGNRTTNFEIYSVNVDGTDVVQLTNDPGIDQLPAYSPDGTKIVFVSTRDAPAGGLDGEIYIMNVDGTGVTRLTNQVGDDSWPRWSPDGTRIIFQSNRDGNLELYTMNADGSDVVRVTNSPSTDYRPSWRP